MTIHYPSDGMFTDEEVVTEDGQFKRWRTAVPLPYEVSTWRKKVYRCACDKEFRNVEAYELHYRKAYEEEQHLTQLQTKADEVKEK